MMNWETTKPVEPSVIPGWARNAGFRKCFIFQGNSMLPTLIPGQLMYIREGIQDIHPGDVIVYRESTGDKFTVHRVVRKKGLGWITRGDNNSRPDPLPIKSTQLIGRVELVETRDLIRPIRRGRPILWHARMRWALKAGKKKIPPYIRNIYQKIRQSGITVTVLNKFMGKHIRTIRLHTPQGIVIKVTYRGKTIARWIEGQEIFYCRKPFDLIVKRRDTKL